MARSDDFFKMYEHPLWQQKRLRIMERDGWTCVWCQRKDITLHVHHAYYERGAKPWEYEDIYLRTFCDPCHAKAEEVKKNILKMIGVMSPENGLVFLRMATSLCEKSVGTSDIVVDSLSTRNRSFRDVISPPTEEKKALIAELNSADHERAIEILRELQRAG